MFPLEAQITESYFRSRAFETISAAHLSLKEFVGFRVSSFRYTTFNPIFLARRSALCRGVPPSPIVTAFLTSGSKGLNFQNVMGPVSAVSFNCSKS